MFWGHFFSFIKVGGWIKGELMSDVLIGTQLGRWNTNTQTHSVLSQWYGVSGGATQMPPNSEHTSCFVRLLTINTHLTMPTTKEKACKCAQTQFICFFELTAGRQQSKSMLFWTCKSVTLLYDVGGCFWLIFSSGKSQFTHNLLFVTIDNSRPYSHTHLKSISQIIFTFNSATINVTKSYYTHNPARDTLPM